MCGLDTGRISRTMPTRGPVRSEDAGLLPQLPQRVGDDPGPGDRPVPGGPVPARQPEVLGFGEAAGQSRDGALVRGVAVDECDVAVGHRHGVGHDLLAPSPRGPQAGAQTDTRVGEQLRVAGVDRTAVLVGRPPTGDGPCGDAGVHAPHAVTAGRHRHVAAARDAVGYPVEAGRHLHDPGLGDGQAARPGAQPGRMGVAVHGCDVPGDDVEFGVGVGGVTGALAAGEGRRSGHEVKLADRTDLRTWVSRWHRRHCGETLADLRGFRQPETPRRSLAVYVVIQSTEIGARYCSGSAILLDCETSA